MILYFNFVLFQFDFTNFIKYGVNFSFSESKLKTEMWYFERDAK